MLPILLLSSILGVEPTPQEALELKGLRQMTQVQAKTIRILQLRLQMQEEVTAYQATVAAFDSTAKELQSLGCKADINAGMIDCTKPPTPKKEIK